MDKSGLPFKRLIFELYLKPSILALSLYQIIVTSSFTAQQILLAAYLDQLGYFEGYSLLSGIILAVYFIFSFALGPIWGTLSDLHGRKYLMILSNWVSGIGFIGLIAIPHPLIMLIMNSLVGIGSSIRVGSTVALWVQHSPQKRLGESLGYSNIILGVGGGIGVIFIGFFKLMNLIQFSFIFFGLLLFITAIPIFFLSDSGDYKVFSLSSTYELLIGSVKGNFKNNFFLTRPIIQVSIHWAAFSVIISFGTYLIPILELIIDEIPMDINIPVNLLILIVVALFISIVGGLLIWGSISDNWRIKPVLLIGFIGTCFLAIFTATLIELDLIVPLLNGLQFYNLTSILTVIVFLFCLFMAISLIPTPMTWITVLVGENDLAKAMSLRMALIAIGTIIGTIIGPMIIVDFGISGLLFVILFLLLISAVILL
ncbi:MAG: MFS transporter [Candidatus Hodarchaeota archaeon]